ncbi:Cytochrome C oxidase, cbb3-type, subunit III [Atopomonas hussainii]|uniref:Cytochrome C oxidase, cbb3-type, subunit III n=1 Tax=Atopomonas hussainii TaxID=1429083 RepID=A0A1H7KLU9_9GAMM|nr:cytochrome c [Atopomonas hussainii]SEK87811.1 Cytochrome C oxidase, cbb3-type, subunit III [Atopomonas hussainii]
MKKTVLTLVLAGAVGAGAVLAGAYSGLVNVAADDPHSPAVLAFLTMARERSIAVRARDIAVPDLSDQALVTTGAGNYNAMCIGCHLAPGLAQTEMSQALYPAPPNLAKVGVNGSPAEAFWVIKHGIKATGMPAWGKSMGDEYIWGMVAFLQQLPQLDAQQYQALVAASSGHQHGGGESHMHNHEGQHGSNTPAHHDQAAEPSTPHEPMMDHAAMAKQGEQAMQGAAKTVHVHSDGSEHEHTNVAPKAPTNTHLHSDGQEHMH